MTSKIYGPALLALVACSASPSVENFQAPIITGVGGITYQVGDIILDPAELRAIVIDNGLVRVTYEETTPASEPTSHGLTWFDGAAWRTVFPPQYRDWSGFVVPRALPYDEAEIVEASDTMSIVAWRIREHRLDVPYLGNWGITSRDHQRLANYEAGGTVPKRITSVRVTKLVGVAAGDAGYYRAWHSDPRLAAPMSTLAIGTNPNNDSDYGEREFGLEFGSAVVWSSNPAAGVAHFPAWGQRVEWDVAEAAIGSAIPNHVWWAGIDDSLAGVALHPAYAATQGPPGFPRQQPTGPWYVASIPAWGGHSNVVSFMVYPHPLEVGAWQFSDDHLGTAVTHYTHSWEGPDGRPRRWQVYTGVLGYTANPADGYACEPTTQIRADVAARAATVQWRE